MTETCDVWEQTWNALTSEESTPTKNCAYACLAVVATTFVVSSLTGNYSQVDKIWSIVPLIYCWIVLCDERTLLMAIVATVWGIRLTWNFSRRGGYTWPPWNGDEDYRWKYLQDGFLLSILQNKSAWIAFNFLFVSLYQNILLFLIAAPSVVAHIAVTSCGQEAPLNTYDLLATVMVLTFVVITTLADNEQYKFQTVKYRLKNAGKPLTGEYADGYKTSGLFAIVRKPNYAAEQGVWISFYCYSVAAFNGDRIFNWSLSGCVMLSLLFQGSGWLTEQITLGKYPKYAQYREEVPLYMPNPMTLLRMNDGSNKKTE